MKTYDIKIRDSVIDPNTPSFESHEGYYKKRSDSSKTLFKVWIYLEGKDLAFVKRAKYILHSSFRNREHYVDRTPRNQNCALEIWTWGLFEVKVEIDVLSGQKIKLEHYLTYGDEIETKKNINWLKM